VRREPFSCDGSASSRGSRIHGSVGAASEGWRTT
jgi:hypothetical protein